MIATSIVFGRDVPHTRNAIIESAYGRWGQGIWIRTTNKWMIAHGPDEMIAVIHFDERLFDDADKIGVKIEQTQDGDTIIHCKYAALPVVRTYFELWDVLDPVAIKKEKRAHDKLVNKLDVPEFIELLNKERVLNYLEPVTLEQVMERVSKRFDTDPDGKIRIIGDKAGLFKFLLHMLDKEFGNPTRLERILKEKKPRVSSHRLPIAKGKKHDVQFPASTVAAVKRFLRAFEQEVKHEHDMLTELAKMKAEGSKNKAKVANYQRVANAYHALRRLVKTLEAGHIPTASQARWYKEARSIWDEEAVKWRAFIVLGGKRAWYDGLAHDLDLAEKNLFGG